MTNDRFNSHAFAGGTVNRANVFPAHEATAPALERPGPIGALAGAIEDRLAVWQLSRKSDHVLADIGVSRETLAADVASARSAAAARRGALVSQRLAAWREERRIYRELSSYSDAELADLGMGRGDVRAAARGHAVMLFRDAGLVDGHFSTDGRPVAANGVALRRAA